MDNNSTKDDRRFKTCKSRRETAVQGTNDSSIVSKCSMANIGYFTDTYLQEFVSKVARRAPLIHRGYYIRAKTIDYLLKKFLKSDSRHKQIISLGAGFDSAYFRLKAEGELDSVSFFEVDFPDVVKRKCAIIQTKDVLKNLIPDLDKQPINRNPLIEIQTDSYTLVGVDLTQLNTLEALLLHCGADVDTPTFLLSECVLTYMTRRCSSAVIHWAAETFTNAVFVLYEQIRPDDAFGLFMQRHFQVIGSPLKCINSFPSLQSQLDRFYKQGWKRTEAMDMNQFYHHLVTKEERHLVEHIEPFDEYEEWNLKCSHYMVLCGYNGDCTNLLQDIQQTADCTSKHSSKSDGKTGNPDHPSVCFIPVTTETMLLRFGHSSICLHGNKTVLTVGGFGEQGGKHRRLIDIAITNLETMETIIILPDVDPKFLEVNRMHHVMCALSDNTVILIGGRTSPVRLCSQILRLHLSTSTSDLTSNDSQSDSVTQPSKGGVCVKDVKNSGSNVDERNSLCSNKENLPNIENSRQYKEKIVSDNLNFCDNQKEKCETSGQRHKFSYSNTDTNKDSLNCDHIDQSNNAVEGSTDTGSLVHSENRSEKCDQWNVRFSVMTQNGDIPCPRWRHTATAVHIQGEEQILMYGGRTDRHLALADAYLLHTKTGVWTKVNASFADVPGFRQAHSSTCNDKAVFVSGGLNLDLQPLNSVCTYDLKTNIWEEFSVKGKLLKRYSHTSHIIEDYLILIGGVNLQHSPPGVAVVHLPSGRCIEFPLPEQQIDSLRMLHRHTSTYLGNKQFLIIGGGGNCFSFGTHLNVTPVILDLTECLQHASRHFSRE